MFVVCFDRHGVSSANGMEIYNAPRIEIMGSLVAMNNDIALHVDSSVSSKETTIEIELYGYQLRQ